MTRTTYSPFLLLHISRQGDIGGFALLPGQVHFPEVQNPQLDRAVTISVRNEPEFILSAIPMAALVEATGSTGVQLETGKACLGGERLGHVGNESNGSPLAHFLQLALPRG